MAFKLRGTGANSSKMYLFPTSDAAAVGSRQWEYVSADAPATVDGSAYISDSTDDGDIAIDMLKIGDLIWAYQVGSISDTRSIEDDKSTGITDISLHLVLWNSGTFIDLSDDLLAATPTYGD